jgi:predicted glycosyltransferase involved in capsule biosynthesis
MSHKEISIVAAAYGIDDITIRNFIDYNRLVFFEFSVDVIIISDRKIELNCQNATCYTYPIKQTPFLYKTKILNYGIRKTTKRDIVFTIDIDLVMKREFFTRATEVIKDGTGCYYLVRMVGNIKDIDKDMKDLPHMGGGYGTVGMTYNDWDKIDGYNEEFYGWGGEDWDVCKRSEKVISMLRCEDYPIYHLSHKPRNGKGDIFEKHEAINSRLYWKSDWENKKWGLIDV